jgi:uncharacterized protein
MQIDYPFHFDSRGRTAEASMGKHIRNLIEQLLFTRLGERVNRPDFGGGLLQLVFEPNSTELEATLQYTVGAALQRWLGDLIEVVDLAIEDQDETLRISITYRVRRTGTVYVESFEQGGAL